MKCIQKGGKNEKQNVNTVENLCWQNVKHVCFFLCAL